ncbi:hypothetical protein H696_03424 [Fonticula alba]|uniref:Anaphase-promoting complex subunit 4 WD40 domain-containing protein n=1 Tax=Fonticula alba TaxID=691883 RepID=A0A058Z6S7_FONAL|nr:hypothetical protein H696_03424 [Fonticula alba]KCV69959.1 hypothetical protein H696_03424 [Fonticula alba]|eukprot:XP_009495565.1 hypothetical protein H696_03424 [Fonticula alba]
MDLDDENYPRPRRPRPSGGLLGPVDRPDGDLAHHDRYLPGRTIDNDPDSVYYRVLHHPGPVTTPATAGAAAAGGPSRAALGSGAGPIGIGGSSAGPLSAVSASLPPLAGMTALSPGRSHYQKRILSLVGLERRRSILNYRLEGEFSLPVAALSGSSSTELELSGPVRLPSVGEKRAREVAAFHAVAAAVAIPGGRPGNSGGGGGGGGGSIGTGAGTGAYATAADAVLRSAQRRPGAGLSRRGPSGRALSGAESAGIARSVPAHPEKVLDLPDLVDDFYLNLLDWSMTDDIAIALARSVFVWNAGTGSAVELLNLADCSAGESALGNYVSALRWAPWSGPGGGPTTLAMATARGGLQLWDAAAGCMTADLSPSLGLGSCPSDADLGAHRIGVLSWNGAVLSAGTRQGRLLHIDTRAARGLISSTVGSHGGMEVCGLQWSPDGARLASGGNDNSLLIWEAASALSTSPALLYDHAAKRSRRGPPRSATGQVAWIIPDSRLVAATAGGRSLSIGGRMLLPGATPGAAGGPASAAPAPLPAPNVEYGQPIMRVPYRAAVRALAWCPWKPSLLAAGGGQADRTIRLVDASTGAVVSSTETGSQVCALGWSEDYQELISTHGYPSNQITLWHYPDMRPVAELRRHTQRVLHMALSPDGQMVATASPDETLCLWRCFELARPLPVPGARHADSGLDRVSAIGAARLQTKVSGVLGFGPPDTGVGGPGFGGFSSFVADPTGDGTAPALRTARDLHSSVVFR